MDVETMLDFRNAVEPDRVHRRVYNDPDVFEAEMQRIFKKVWTYVGHESQVPNPGDYWTVWIADQPMIMVRHQDNRVYVLYNRCPHRGTMICANRHGNAGKAFVCSYHAWQFNTDGTARAISLPHGYDGTRLDLDSPECNMKPAPRVDSYRGFVFASLAEDGPSLLEWLGPAKVAFDDMCDRSPEGEVEVVPNCFRVLQRSNWKLFLENQLDVAHATVTHESTGRAAREVEDDLRDHAGEVPFDYHFLSAFTIPLGEWDKMTTINHPLGHGVLQGYMSLRPQDPDSLAYEALMEKSYGKAKADEILSRNIHHVLVYPGLSVQPPLQQLRAIRPLGIDKTLTEIWHFRLKGAPEAIYRRSLGYYNLVNSPSTLVNADDLWNFWKSHQGLASEGGEWVSLHRYAGRDDDEDGVIRTRIGTSEAPLRNMFQAWSRYMTANW